MPRDFAGFPGTYLPSASDEIARPRAASDQTGIAMLARQHKGEALKDLLPSDSQIAPTACASCTVPEFVGTQVNATSRQRG